MKKVTLPKLKAKLQDVFNAYIRQRDEGKTCISCGQMKVLQAGHFFPVRGYDGLRYDEDNVQGECAGCNCFDDSHLIYYQRNLQERIGTERFKALLSRAAHYRIHGHKWHRHELEEKIQYYKQKIHETQDSVF